MNNKFLPDSYKQDIYNLMFSLKQNNMSVSTYMRGFEQLLLRGGIHEPQEQTMARFFNGLGPLVVTKAEIQTYFTLNDVCKLALKVKKRRKEKKVLSKPFSKEHSSERPQFKPFCIPKIKSSSKIDKYKVVAPSSLKELPKRLEGKKCCKCQGYGHLQYDCPN